MAKRQLRGSIAQGQPPATVDHAIPLAGAAVPAFILPHRFEDFEGFRETTLSVFTDKLTNATLRALGQVLYDLGLQGAQEWPHPPGGAYFHQCQAVLGDLRHLEGWFAHLDIQRTQAALAPEEKRVSVACGGFRLAVQAIGDQFQRELGVHVVGDSGTATESIRTPLPDVEQVAALIAPLSWPEGAFNARSWHIARGVRGEGEGNAALLHQLRVRGDVYGDGEKPAFGPYHILALELLTMLREWGGDAALQALGVGTLAEHLLAAPGIPPAVAEHYAKAL
jgi:hypothetical protein